MQEHAILARRLRRYLNDCKIYLLYGAPTNTERSFLPGESPVETWTYSNNVKRVFRFEEHTHGEYKLTDVRELVVGN